MKNKRLTQIKATIKLMGNAIETLTRKIERLEQSPMDEDSARLLGEIEQAKKNALKGIEYLEKSGPLKLMEEAWEMLKSEYQEKVIPHE